MRDRESIIGELHNDRWWRIKRAAYTGCLISFGQVVGDSEVSNALIKSIKIMAVIFFSPTALKRWTLTCRLHVSVEWKSLLPLWWRVSRSKFLFLNKISHKLDGAVQYVWCSPPACLQSWLGFNLAGMPAIKLCDGFSCRGRMFAFVREVSQAVPAATSSRASGWAPTRRMKTNRNICYRVFLQKREFILRGTHKY